MNEQTLSRSLRNLDWNLLKVFSEIVRSGSVTGAAKAMARQQPAVSSALKRLESHLGSVLCRRGPGGFELTDEGKALWEVCERIESELAVLPARFADIAKGLAIEFRIVMINNLVSTKLDFTFANFNHLNPRTELLINVASCSEIEQMVLKNEAELGISPKMNPCGNLQYTWLYREHLILVCGREHRLYGQSVSDPVRFENEPFILPHNDEATPLRHYRERHGWGKVIAGQSMDMNEIKRMVLAGMGVALLPEEFVKADLTRGTIWKLMTPSKETQTDIFIINNPDNPRNFAVKQFLEVLANSPELPDKGRDRPARPTCPPQPSAG